MCGLGSVRVRLLSGHVAAQGGGGKGVGVLVELRLLRVLAGLSLYIMSKRPWTEGQCSLHVPVFQHQRLLHQLCALGFPTSITPQAPVEFHHVVASGFSDIGMLDAEPAQQLQQTAAQRERERGTRSRSLRA